MFDIIIQNIDKLTISLIYPISIILAAGIILYFDGLLFSGGKGWVKGIKETFTSFNKGFLFFMANIIGMIVIGYIV